MAYKQDGTKIQLAAGGASWIHDSPGSNPFLPVSYTQYSHFGKEDVKLTPQSSPKQGAVVNFLLDNVGDVCLHMYVKVKSKGVNPPQGWLAERVATSFKLYSGDTLLDFYNTNYQRYYYNAYLSQDQKSKWDKMTSPESTQGEQLYLPLVFGFCQHGEETLPTVAMFNRKIRVEITFERGSAGYSGLFEYGTFEVWASVAYLRGKEFERTKFTNELLLLNTTTNDSKTIKNDSAPWNVPAITELKAKMGLQRCVKEIFFGAVLDLGTFTRKNEFPFEWVDEGNQNQSYSNVFISNAQTCTQPHQSLGVVRLKSANLMGSGNIASAQIIADKRQVTPLMDQKFFNLLQTYYRHSGCPAPGYMYYSWALQPEITQPTGHINTSLFRDIEMIMNFRNGLSDNLTGDNDKIKFEWFSDMISFMQKRDGMLKYLSQE